MVSRAVGSLFLSCVLVVVFCDDPEVQLVKNLIASSNDHFRHQNQAEISLPDTSLLFEAVQFRKGRLGQFDSVELQPHPKIVSHTSVYGTVYIYNFKTALKNLTINYQFYLNLPFFANYGNVIITVAKNSFQTEGRILIKHNGTCSAMLKDAKVVQFGDIEVRFQPDNTPFITKIYQALLNVIHEQMIPIINRAILEEINRSYFKQKFSELACAEVKLNSTATTPTTKQ